MKTLLIHPKDPTTDFLSIIYSDYKNDENWTIINEYIGKRLIKKAIKEHDRIIMMGHGTEKGLYDPDTYNNIIDGSLVYLLHEKKDSIYIWCNADVFVEKHGLTGFYTGMIISDFEEAMLYCVDASNNDIEKSNRKFGLFISKYLSTDYKLMAENVKNDYIDENNNVISFNRNNIYYK